MQQSSSSSTVPCVLLTGFDAFGGDSINPSWLAAQSLRGRRIAGHRMVTAQLPTEFDTSLGELRRLLRMHRPALVICVGLAGGRSAIGLERIAINVNDARIADNAARQPVDTPVVSGGPAAYFSTLPIKAMVRAMQDAGIAAEVSQTAGTFVCNHVFYGLMHMLARGRSFKKTRGGFIHVPYLPQQGQPSLALETLTQALGLAVKTALLTPHDTAEGAGALN